MCSRVGVANLASGNLPVLKTPLGRERCRLTYILLL